MSRFWSPLLVLALCLLVFLAAMGCSYAALPLRVASHFDGSGRADGFMSRDDEIVFMGSFGILFAGFFILLTACLRWMPVELVNLPHRDYWLAPERRCATSAVFLRFGIWEAALSLLFVAGLQVMVVGANAPGMSPEIINSGFWLVGGFFIVLTVIGTVLLLRRFWQRPEGV
jgi:hypothetical protein